MRLRSTSSRNSFQKRCGSLSRSFSVWRSQLWFRTKALSRYSDLVDNIIRREVNKLGEATDDARLKLKQYELPEILDGVTTTSPSLLPEGLKTDLAGVEQCGGLAALEDVDLSSSISYSETCGSLDSNQPQRSERDCQDRVGFYGDRTR